jgi:selenide, water dikinase
MDYRRALSQMKQLNRRASEIASRYGVHGMTDITGFGLAGHALRMAQASRVSLLIRTADIPLLPGAYRVFEKGSIPGATFRNLEFTGNEAHYTRGVDYTLKMLAHDAQTSGGLLMAVEADLALPMVRELNSLDPPVEACIIGDVLAESPRRIYFE